MRGRDRPTWCDRVGDAGRQANALTDVWTFLLRQPMFREWGNAWRFVRVTPASRQTLPAVWRLFLITDFPAIYSGVIFRWSLTPRWQTTFHISHINGDGWNRTLLNIRWEGSRVSNSPHSNSGHWAACRAAPGKYPPPSWVRATESTHFNTTPRLFRPQRRFSIHFAQKIVRR
jgi:hypothetical protein